jgi:uncharacterized protein YcbK (DUF882 family)
MDRNGFNRRSFLKLAGGLMAGGAVLPSWAQHRPRQVRSLHLYHLHTGEQLHTPFWIEGEYLDEGLAQINQVLRDHRNGEIVEIDLQLLELLHDIQLTLGSSQPFHVVSAYRSPQTNALLHRNSSAVAKKSLHMQGKAIDIKLPDISLRDLKQGALKLGRGGVGYYPRDGFVHLDVGRSRFWRG